jgi:hypothetical protein
MSVSPKSNRMITRNWSILAYSTLAVTLFVSACEKPASNSLFPDSFDTLPQPVVTQVSPADSFFGGIDYIDISGDHFTNDLSNVAVYFDEHPSTIISGDNNSLRIRPPQIAGDSLRLRVRVLGADKFSETIFYTLEEVVQVVPRQRPGDVPQGIAYTSGEFYFTTISSGSPGGIRVIRNDANVSVAPAQNFSYAKLRYGPDGRIYTVRAGIIPFIYVLPSEGTTPVTFVNPGGTRSETIDFDSRGNIWGGGQNEGRTQNNLYRVDPNASPIYYTFNADIMAVRYFDGAVYAAVRNTVAGQAQFKIQKFSLNADYVVVSDEVYHDFTDLAGGTTSFAIRDITFAEDGTLYVGTNRTTDSIYQIDVNGNRSVLHPGILSQPIIAFGWETSTTKMLAVLEGLSDDLPQQIVRIEMLKTGAPY